MLRAVVDTNLIVSGIAGTIVPSQLLKSWREEKFILVTSFPILAEIREVLKRPKIKKLTRLGPKEQKEILRMLFTRASVVAGEILPQVCRDPGDNMILGCALEGLADYLVSGDKDLLDLKEYEGVKIVTARNFLEIINGFSEKS